ncbi:PIN domain-containing protein [Streptomyces sp. NBC_00414]|uniref:PIN domain-containing protein n=1 Tax=Streptomyces sp. NBC_00414 TaxID=2975739 RepID=UPI002E2025EB
MTEHRSSTFTLGYEEFGRKSEQFIDQEIRSSSIVLDTNAVLNLYRMKPSARNEYLRVLEKVATRIWIPRQVADEFHRNRISCVDSHAKSLSEKYDKVAEAAKVLVAALGDFYKLHSLADGRSAQHLAPLNQSISEITDTIAAEVSEYDLTPGALLSQDPILERLGVIFDGRVGQEISNNEKEERKKEALKRGKESTPPGYLDVQKKGDDGVGDYLIWMEMLEHAKDKKKNILFISTDTKGDWIRFQCGMAVGPRPELVEEMRTIAEVGYHQITLAHFLARAAHVLDVQVSQATIDQANETPLDFGKAMRHIERRAHDIADLEGRISTVKDMLDGITQRKEAAQRQLSVASERATMEDSQLRRDQLLAEASDAEAYFRSIEEQHRSALNGLGALEAQRASFITEVQVLEQYAI